MSRVIKEDLGQLVRRVIRQKNLKPRDVVHKAGGGITKSNLSKIMTNNATNLTLETLFALARGLGEDPHTLLTAAYGHPPASVSQPEELAELSAAEFAAMMQKVANNLDLIEIMRAATELWPEEYASVLRYVEVLNQRKQKPGHSRKKIPQGTANS
jgi:transcriptional regulator with XRE-family HTH domain